MFLFDFFHSFLPALNPIGFGAADFLELGVAVSLILATLVWRPWIEPYAVRLAEKTFWCMIILALLPVALRLALLRHHPVPTPDIYDEFSHLLVADTLRHFRLANPAHPLPQFFETFFVLQQPTYSSIYPVGQGLTLAIGRAVFGHAWAGVLLATAAFCSLCYWMLRGWVAPPWALLGGSLAVMEFGPLNQWTNGYWGGGLSAAAGCLVFGALPRLKARQRTCDAVLLGAGLAMHLLARPYESIFLVLSVAAFLAPDWRQMLKPAAIVALTVAPAIGLTLLQNKAVTGSWTMLPYTLSQEQYGVPAALTFQPTPTPHRPLTREQELDYKMQSGFRGPGPETLATFLVRLEYRVRFYRFYFLPALYLALFAFFWALREWRYVWVLLTPIVFALGVNFFPAFRFHYVAGVVCLFILVSVVGLQRIGPAPARLIVALCAGHFLFWYSLHLVEDRDFSRAMLQYETWDSINHQNPERRIAVNREIERTPGKLLVFVRYYPQHVFQEEWVYNAADIDGARVVWARDLGAAENEKLRKCYPDRTAMLLKPDLRPPQLTAYEAELPPSLPPAPAVQPKKPALRFEPIPQAAPSCVGRPPFSFDNYPEFEEKS